MFLFLEFFLEQWNEWMWNQIFKNRAIHSYAEPCRTVCVCASSQPAITSVSILCIYVEKYLKKATTFANEIRRIKVIFIHTWKNQHIARNKLTWIIFFRCVARKKRRPRRVLFFHYFLVNGFLTENFRGFAMHRSHIQALYKHERSHTCADYYETYFTIFILRANFITSTY